MPQEIITITMDTAKPEMAPAKFLAILAYPQADDADKRGTFMMALRAEYFTILAHDVERRGQPITVEPALLALERSHRDLLGRSYKDGVRRIRDDRLTAARMAATVMYYDHAGEKINVTKVAEYVANLHADSGGGETSNIFRGRWGPSRPVLHLALALRDAINARTGADGDYPLHDLLDRPDWIGTAIPAAETIRQHIVGSPLFSGIKDSQTVKLELI